MQCWQCGRSVRQGAKLCIYCGAKLADDEEQEAPRASESRSGRRSSEQGGYRSATSRRDEDDQGDVSPYDAASKEHAAYNQARNGDDRHGRRDRAPSHPRDDSDYPDRSVNYPRPRESRSRDPMDDPRAPIQRARGTMPPSGRERREPNRHDDARYSAKDDPSGVGDGYRRSAREHAPEERQHRASRAGRDDD
ncbi:MAG: zinc-ribbon domain-containing protein, partial [Ktedonobacterales bacterium]